MQLSLEEHDARFLKSQAALHGKTVSDFVVYLAHDEANIDILVNALKQISQYQGDADVVAAQALHEWVVSGEKP